MTIPAYYGEQPKEIREEAERRLGKFLEAARAGTASHGMVGSKVEALWNVLELPDRISQLIAERDGEREARHKSDAALRGKDAAMNVLFDRLHKAGVDTSDLIP